MEENKLKKIEITIPQNEPMLESAFLEFIDKEFNQKATFKTEKISEEVKFKDPSMADIVWKVMQFYATVEGTLQFTERIAKIERVKKLVDAIEKAGKSVYVKVGETDVLDLLGMSVDDIIDIL